MENNTVLITGLPRSGTTLCCWLINKADNSVALNEPMPVHEMLHKSPTDTLDFTGEWLLQQREIIRKTGKASMKQAEGQLPSNSYNLQKNESGLRSSFVEPGEIQIEKSLSPDYLLAVKHNGAFCALLPQLSQRYSYLGIVRNPLAVLLSWNSVDIPVRTGHMPVAETLDPELNTSLSFHKDVIDRQLCILHWFFHRFSTYLTPDRIVRYETIIETGGSILFNTLNIDNTSDIHLHNKNINTYYPIELVENYADVLIKNETIFNTFYSTEDIRTLARQYCQM